MRAELDCYPCFMRQALDAARMAAADERLQHRILQRVAALIAAFHEDAGPIEMGREIHAIVRELTGNADPYRAAKAASNQQALALYPALRRYVHDAADPLRAAAALAAAGNVIDYGPNPRFDLPLAIKEALAADFGGDDLPLFRDLLASNRQLLYIADNAGEIVFDRLLLEQLRERGIAVTFVVRGGPVLNDATVDDARAVGITKLAEVISSEDRSPGLLLQHAGAVVRERFDRASLILAKGQGNYESLSEERAPLFFLLKAKCPVIARRLGVAVGATVLRAAAGFPPLEQRTPSAGAR